MKIALVGYGKMGKTIERLALKRGYEIVYKGSSSRTEGIITDADVAIEFSTPETAFENIKTCLENNIPTVSGTTGWTDQFDKIIKFCEERNGSFLWASNFSVGVNLFFNLNDRLAKIMRSWGEYKPSVTEIHHLEKKDTPSGTAISIAEGILKHSEMNEWSLDSVDGNKLNIHAKRESDVKGLHEVSFTSEIDSISIKHEAFNRDGFGIGAIAAAEWLQNKKGIYTMKDVLGLNDNS